MNDKLDQGIAKAAKEVLWHVDAKLEEGGWDQPPMLYLAVYEKADDLAALGLIPMLGWDLVWARLPNIQDALNAIVTVLNAYPPALKHATFPTKNLFGVVLAMEAWVLKMDKDDKDAAAKEAVARAHTIHQHPDRVESRGIYLHPVEGPPAFLAHERDGIAQLHEGVHSGEVPRLLGELNKALIT